MVTQHQLQRIIQKQKGLKVQKRFPKDGCKDYLCKFCFYGFDESLEEISPQNGPPKKINKIIFINFGGRKKKLLFCWYFRHISLCFYSNFNWESLLDVELNSTSNEYPLDILLTDPATPNTRSCLSGSCIYTFFRYFLFFG